LKARNRECEIHRFNSLSPASGPQSRGSLRERKTFLELPTLAWTPQSSIDRNRARRPLHCNG